MAKRIFASYNCTFSYSKMFYKFIIHVNKYKTQVVDSGWGQMKHLYPKSYSYLAQTLFIECMLLVPEDLLEVLQPCFNGKNLKFHAFFFNIVIYFYFTIIHLTVTAFLTDLYHINWQVVTTITNAYKCNFISLKILHMKIL